MRPDGKIKIDYYTPPPKIRWPVSALAQWGFFWGVLSQLCTIAVHGGSINGVQTSPTRWDMPGLQWLLCGIAIWVNVRALRQIRRYKQLDMPLGGIGWAIAGLSLAGLKVLMLCLLYST